jgi:hypothetical protein
MCVNFDYYWTSGADDPEGCGPCNTALTIYGLEGAARYALTENTGLSFRGGWLYYNDVGFDGADASLWSLAATVDHSLTENLVLKGEVRYDRGWSQNTRRNSFFVSDDDAIGYDDDTGDFDIPSAEEYYDNNDQVLALIQMLYSF